MHVFVTVYSPHVTVLRAYPGFSFGGPCWVLVYRPSTIRALHTYIYLYLYAYIINEVTSR